MRAQTVQTWIARQLFVRQRLANVCTSYLLFLMVVTTKHSLAEAARFSGLHKSHFSKMLKAHSNVATSTLERLSKKQAQQVAKARHKLKELPWHMAIVVDSTLQRSNVAPVRIQKTPQRSIMGQALSLGISGPMAWCSSMTS
jgi:hypothetical protein